MALTYTGPIESARAIVRLAEQADLSALMGVNGDEQVRRFVPYEAWKSPPDADVCLARMADLQTKGLALQFVVAARSSGAAIGTNRAAAPHLDTCSVATIGGKATCVRC
jgi:hypothetical protein